MKADKPKKVKGSEYLFENKGEPSSKAKYSI